MCRVCCHTVNGTGAVPSSAATLLTARCGGGGGVGQGTTTVGFGSGGGGTTSIGFGSSTGGSSTGSTVVQTPLTTASRLNTAPAAGAE